MTKKRNEKKTVPRLLDIVCNKENHNRWLPELTDLKSVVENSRWHNNECVYDHSLSVTRSACYFATQYGLDGLLEKDKMDSTQLSAPSRYELFLLGTILHDIGKKDTLITENGQATCPGHEECGAELSRNVTSRLQLSVEDSERVYSIVKHHGKLNGFSKRRSRFEIESYPLKQEQAEIFPELLLISYSDLLSSSLAQHDPSEYELRRDLLFCELREYGR